MSKEDMNEFITSVRDPYINVNLCHELDDPEEIHDEIHF